MPDPSRPSVSLRASKLEQLPNPPHRAYPVFWSIAAMRSLEEALHQQAQPDRQHEMLGIYNRLIVDAFPQSTIFVTQRLGGFSATKRQHVLTVEAFPACDSSSKLGVETAPEAHILKIGLVEPIDGEAGGWLAICPYGGDRDPILLPLKPHSLQLRDEAGHHWKAIRYGNASNTIGLGRAMPLEETVIDACRFGVLDADSVEQCVLQVFDRLTSALYQRASEVECSVETLDRWIGWIHDAPFSVLIEQTIGDQSKFTQASDQWREPANAKMIRDTQRALHLLHQENHKYRTSQPPVDVVDTYLQLMRWCQFVQSEIANVQQTPKPKPVNRLTTLSVPPLSLPSIMRGCGHADLHGRNILVGIYDRRAANPTVFDYENAGSDRIIGWDFVKLELELKSRTMEKILCHERQPDFIRAVARFEFELDDVSQHAILTSWENVGGDFQPRFASLAKIILAIRAKAATALGSRRRHGCWYEEYRFLLGLCSMMAVRYQNSSRVQLSLYLAGCVAAERCQWRSKLEQWNRNQFQLWQEASSSQHESPLFVGWQIPHQAAIDWIQSGETDQIQQARHLLSILVEQFPHQPAILETYILALLELGDDEEAQHCYATAQERFAGLTEELACRFGRIEKNRGDTALNQQQWTEAINHYQASVRCYGDAYELNENHYPKVNLASLHLSLSVCWKSAGNPVESARHHQQSLTHARELVETRSQWVTLTADDAMWHLATLAEAQHLLGNESEAVELYNQVAQSESANPRNQKAIDRQRAWNQANLDALASGMR